MKLLFARKRAHIVIRTAKRNITLILNNRYALITSAMKRSMAQLQYTIPIGRVGIMHVGCCLSQT